MKEYDVEKVRVASPDGGYDVIFSGKLENVKEYFDTDRKVLIVTDENVGPLYAGTLASAIPGAKVLTLPAGETTKSREYLGAVWRAALDAGLTRRDCIIALGGGVIGDLSGFAASTYMRGIDFYNVPTTVLSMIDSSVGGKCAIDFEGYKNVVGSFYNPRAVLIDPDLLGTLDDRQYANGLAEGIKMAATLDASLFEYIEGCEDLRGDFGIIKEAVKLKIGVVERDWREAGLRRVLNFGHTAAHAIESVSGFGEILHGEAVALGMLPMTRGAARARLEAVLKRASLPTKIPFPAGALREAVRHDKKMANGKVSCVVCPEIGKYEFVNYTPEQFLELIAEEI